MKPRPWERIPGETAKAFEAFAVYRDMGRDRTQVKAGAKLRKSMGTLQRWTGKNRWVERAALYDDEQDRQTMLDIRRGRADMAKRHANISKDITDKVSEWVKGISKESVKKWSTGDATRALEVAAKLERLTRGEATERTDVTGTLQPSSVSLEDLNLPVSVRQSILDAIEKAEEGGDGGGESEVGSSQDPAESRGKAGF